MFCLTTCECNASGQYSVQFIYIHTEWWHTAAREPLEVQPQFSKAEPLTVATWLNFISKILELSEIREVLRKIFGPTVRHCVACVWFHSLRFCHCV